MMGNEYLATGFGSVDDAEDTDVYSHCLALLDSLPYYQDYKTESYRLLALAPGDKVLDAGCGLGDDVFRMAELVGAGGKVTGLDASEKLIAKAMADQRGQRLSVEFRTGDLLATEFEDGRFNKVRIDRVLQHIADPARAIAELVRVLQVGGILLAYDNDWGTFTINSEQRDVTRRIENAWCDSFKSGWVGRYIPQWFKEAGLSQIAVHPKISIIDDFQTAEAIYNLGQTVSMLIEAGEISADSGRRWLEELQVRTEQGYFTATLTAYSVIGRK
ncbi:MAG TPA: methyltransferase domain-containing protein [Anaerolineae bacterium]|nr:methyltransferase domain-containing protein [Anaerolineae bacterium]